MRKATRNYLLALVMGLLALFQGISGFVLWVVLPRGEGYRGGQGVVDGGLSSGLGIPGLTSMTGQSLP